MIDQIDDETIKKIQDHYMHGDGSIQGIARHYRVSVETVLHHIGQDEMTTVQFVGDQIDQDEAGNAPINGPKTSRVKYDTN